MEQQTLNKDALHRTIHGFVDWVEALKAAAWLMGILGGLFVASLYFIMDNRYIQKTALDRAVGQLQNSLDDLRCERIVARIADFEAQLIVMDSKIRRETDPNDKLQQMDERQLTANRLNQERQNAVQKGCRLDNGNGAH